MDDIITKAEKGGASVILDVNDYIAEAVRQLNDIHSYEKLDCDPTSTYNEIINNAIDNLLKVIPEKVVQSLKNDKPKTPKFYTLPKIHKPNKPGMPTLSIHTRAGFLNVSIFTFNHWSDNFHLTSKTQATFSEN